MKWYLIGPALVRYIYPTLTVEIDVPEDLIDMDPGTFNRSEGTHWTRF